MLQQEKKRIGWIDIAKAIAILLVVWGHTLRGGDVQRVMYSFHVATFFLLSGMTCRVRDIGRQIRTDFLRIMVPYYIFGVASIGIFLVLGGFAADQLDMSTRSSLWDNLLELLVACPKGNRMKFNMPLWFLPCLFVTKLLYYALSKVCRGKQGYIVGGSAVLAVLSFLYTHLVEVSLPFNLSVAGKMLFFFALGRQLFLWITQREKPLPSRAVLLVAGAVSLMLTAVIAWMSPKVNYTGDTFPNVMSFMITALLGSAGVCLLSMGMDRCRVIEYVGRNTLPILLMHKFPILLFQTVGPFKSILADYNSLAGVAVSLGVAALSIVLCLLVAWVLQRYTPFLLGDFSRRPKTPTTD